MTGAADGKVLFGVDVRQDMVECVFVCVTLHAMMADRRNLGPWWETG